jgi:hypothetical protein
MERDSKKFLDELLPALYLPRVRLPEWAGGEAPMQQQAIVDLLDVYACGSPEQIRAAEAQAEPQVLEMARTRRAVILVHEWLTEGLKELTALERATGINKAVGCINPIGRSNATVRGSPATDCRLLSRARTRICADGDVGGFIRVDDTPGTAPAQGLSVLESAGDTRHAARQRPLRARTCGVRKPDRSLARAVPGSPRYRSSSTAPRPDADLLRRRLRKPDPRADDRRPHPDRIYAPHTPRRALLARWVPRADDAVLSFIVVTDHDQHRPANEFLGRLPAPHAGDGVWAASHRGAWAESRRGPRPLRLLRRAPPDRRTARLPEPMGNAPRPRRTRARDRAYSRQPHPIDAQRMPVYLESTNPVSLPRYEALGFRRRAEFGPVHGRLITTMWREAC